MAKKKAEKDEGQGPIYDPDTYRALSEPFEDVDAMNAALTGFFREMREVRAKWRISDVLYVVKDAYIHDGEEVPVMSRSSSGNTLNCLPMAAWLYAKENADHKETMREVLKMGADANPIT